jgi:alpha-ribazole phosphatase
MNLISTYLKELEPSLFLLRHGHIDTGPEMFFVGQTDFPLSRVGRQQAESWQYIFKDIIFEEIISSDLVRCTETAGIIAAGRNQEIRIFPDLREINLGQWERFSVSRIKDQYPKEYEERGSHIDTYRPPGGESFLDLQKRVLKVFLPILENYHQHTLIIGHSGVNRVILSYLLNIPVRDIFGFAQDYGALNIITGNSAKHVVKALNLIPDLSLSP